MMRIPLNDISSDEESRLSANSFFEGDDFFEENNSINDTDSIFEEDRFSVNSEASRSLPEIESSEIFLTKTLTTKEVIHSLTPIEYPPTCEEGIAIVYHIDGWESVDSAFTDVQYSMGKPCGQNQTNCCYFELREMQHKSVDLDSDLRLKINNEVSTNNVKNNTFAVYLAAYKTKCHFKKNGIQCIHSHPPPLPNRVPLTIRTRLQELIRQADDNTTNITPTQILTAGSGSVQVQFISS
ncbi:hypothetical protein C2G38_2215229 [Gigaspora rosea]|uniref:Uncharacterized protein n=1 Tax=Gigaspora rosea TaxID=44941 RepID=A0A397UDL9_9GLOM|nr:hypothetical protein C2G38_2215229 [Gigaspora rosea]